MGNKRDKVKKQNTRQKHYKEIVKQRIATKTPPVQYTRRLKTRKQKRLKPVSLPYENQCFSDDFNRPPKDDSQHVPASFKEMLLSLNGKRHSCGNAGDAVGMRRPDTMVKTPKQGKHESDKSFINRVSREVDEELTKIQFATQQKTEIILDRPIKSRKKVKTVKRLNAKKVRKKFLAEEKRKTGYEHLKDPVKFNEVVSAPPVHLTKPKKIGASKLKTGDIYPLDRLIQT